MHQLLCQEEKARSAGLQMSREGEALAEEMGAMHSLHASKRSRACCWSWRAEDPVFGHHMFKIKKCGEELLLLLFHSKTTKGRQAPTRQTKRLPSQKQALLLACHHTHPPSSRNAALARRGERSAADGVCVMTPFVLGSSPSPTNLRRGSVTPPRLPSHHTRPKPPGLTLKCTEDDCFPLSGTPRPVTGLTPRGALCPNQGTALLF